jgi:S1-C subfamily serine protease
MFLGAVLVSLSVCCAGAPSRGYDGPTEIPYGDAQAAAAVMVDVDCVGEQGLYGGYGSGVIVSSTEVLTAQHVVDCGDGMLVGLKVKDAIGRVLPARVEVLLPGADLARLTVGGWLLAQPMKVAKAREGSLVCMAPAYPERTRACGLVTAVDDDYVWVSMLIRPGNSGSGIYDERGRLVALATNLRTLGGITVGALGRPLGSRGWLVPEPDLI